MAIVPKMSPRESRGPVGIRPLGEERYCIDVLTQIAAIQAALDKVALGLLDGHARTSA